MRDASDRSIKAYVADSGSAAQRNREVRARVNGAEGRGISYLSQPSTNGEVLETNLLRNQALS